MNEYFGCVVAAVLSGSLFYVIGMVCSHKDQDQVSEELKKRLVELSIENHELKDKFTSIMVQLRDGSDISLEDYLYRLDNSAMLGNPSPIVSIYW